MHNCYLSLKGKITTMVFFSEINLLNGISRRTYCPIPGMKKNAGLGPHQQIDSLISNPFVPL